MTKKSKVSVLLTGLGAIGVVVTAVLAIKNYDIYKANLEDAEHEKDSGMSDEEFEDFMTEQGVTEPSEVEYLTKKEKAVIFAKSCYPALIAGLVTEGCIVGAQVLDIQEIAALTGLVGITTAKYKDLTRYLQEHYPEQYKEAMDFINAKKIAEKSDICKKEETYDGKYKCYEPITEQVFYSNIKPEELAKNAAIFVNRQFINDHIVSVFDYIDFLRKEAGAKELKLNPWMHKCGWCLDDEAYDYNIRFSQDGYWIGFYPELLDISDKDGENMVVHSLSLGLPPNDFGEEVYKLYDVPNEHCL